MLTNFFIQNKKKLQTFYNTKSKTNSIYTYRIVKNIEKITLDGMHIREIILNFLRQYNEAVQKFTYNTSEITFILYDIKRLTLYNIMWSIII